MDSTKNGGSRWLDTKINLQNLVSAIIGAAVVASVAWFALVGRVQALEQKDSEHERHFSRVEADIRMQREETSQQFRTVTNDMKDQIGGIGNDVKEIRRYLMDNAAGNRPEIRRWAK